MGDNMSSLNQEVVKIREDAEALLDESTRNGYRVDEKLLQDEIEDREFLLNIDEGQIVNMVRDEMGWSPGGTPHPGPFKQEPFSGVKNPKVAWSLNSRKLMVYLFFTILGEEKESYGKDWNPSVDKHALAQMKSPIAPRLIRYRSDTWTLRSLKTASKFIKNGVATIIWNSPTKGVERIFTTPEKSLPLNCSKVVRNFFVVGEETYTTDDPEILKFFS